MKETFEQILNMLSELGFQWLGNPAARNVEVGYGLILVYDPADSQTDPNAPAEFIYLKRSAQTLLEMIWVDGKAILRINGREVMFPNLDTLAGYVAGRIQLENVMDRLSK